MISKRAILCALSLAIAAGPLWAAQAKKPAAKPRGKTETLACRLGTEDRHARIAVVVIGGRTDSFAYYSKWKPRTCSVYLQRNRDMYSKWADSGNITTVNLEKGAFLIEHKPGEYHFIFRDIDRERYCGMDGVINGSLTIKRGSEQCVLDGDIMVEGTPLGAANLARDMPAPGAGQSDLDAASAFPSPTAPAVVPAAASAPAKPAAAVPVKPDAQAKPAAEAPGKADAESKPQADAPGRAGPAAAAKPAAEGASASPAPAGAAEAAPKAAAATGDAAQKSAQPDSPGPLRSFFRSLAPRPADATTP
jgi:hypothetical protein